MKGTILCVFLCFLINAGDSQRDDLQRTLNDLRNDLENFEKGFVGSVAYFARNSPPNGWLKANGQQISRTTYADLFASIGTTFGSGDGCTTFTLPDLRAEFIRGFCDGRGVDKNRRFGSFQWGSSIPYPGYISGVSHRAGSMGWQDRWYFAGDVFDGGFEPNVRSGEARDGMSFPNDKVQNAMFFLNTTTLGEITSWNVLKGVRPRNIALLACIKY